MSCIVGIINYGLSGNIHSIQKALLKAGAKVRVIECLEDFYHIDKLVVPGVGSFKEAMLELEQKGFIEKIQAFDKPILGICLGMQILSDIGFEYGETQGLGLISAKVQKMTHVALLPHVGFSPIEISREGSILQGLEQAEFYFMHSYSVTHCHNVTSVAEYEGQKLTASIQKGHLYGVQFHPEKSRDAGIKLFENFIRLSE